MFELDAVGRLAPTSEHLSVTAAQRHAVLAGLAERRRARVEARPRSRWRERWRESWRRRRPVLTASNEPA